MAHLSIPRVSVCLLLLAASGCDDPGLLAVEDPRPAPVPAPVLSSTPAPSSSVVGPPAQITIPDEDQLDPLDPTELHVPVPPGQEVVALARAAGLLAVADSGSLPQPTMAAVLASQRLAADVAHADVVATADVIAVTPIVAPDGSPTELFEVLFSVDTLVSGAPAVTWTSRLPQTSSCGPTAPAVGEERLVFLDVGTASAELRIGAPFVPVVAGQVTLHGLSLSVTNFATVIQQNPEIT